MPLMKIGEHCEVVLPKELLDKLNLKPGDYIDLVPRHPQDFPETDEPLDPETEAALREAEEDVRVGRVSPRLRTSEEIAEYFRKLREDA